MDVYYFLQQRTDLIRRFYDSTSASMLEAKRLIEAGEAPFDNPPYDESGEPAFLEEWLQADTELELVGRACVTMRAESLKQFLLTWERLALVGDRPCQKARPTEFNKRGFIAGYVACFGEAFGLDWNACPANMEIVEQVVLARNRSQHGSELVSTDVRHDDETRSRFPRPFFMRPEEAAYDGDDLGSFLNPSLHIIRETLFEALSHVEKLAAWLQEQIEATWHQCTHRVAGDAP